MKRTITGIAVLLSALSLAVGIAGEDLDIPWFTIDGGGEMSSTDGQFEVSGTIGQPDASLVMTDGEFEVTGGFWFRVVAGDCNNDGGVNLFDFIDFAACVTGPGGELPAPECICFDFDEDTDVDLLDWRIFQVSFVGG